MGLGAGQIALDVDIAALIRASTQRPVVRLVQAVAQSIPNTTDTALSFTTEDIDTHGFHDTSTNNSRITPNVAGIYYIQGTVFYVANTSKTIVSANIFKNAGVQAPRGRHLPVAATNGGVSVVTSMLLTANGTTDYFELAANQTSGGAILTSAGGSFASVFECMYVRDL